MNVKQFFRDWVLPIVSAVVIVFLIRHFLLFNVYVPSGSMIPTINKEDKFFVEKIYNTNKIERGDIIVFYSDELQERLIKRTIGLPGDHIVIHDGIVNINGTDLKEDYVKNNMKYDGVFDVPEGKYFFLGDNRAISDDARLWENPYIDKENIEGKAILRYYPFSSFGLMDGK